MHSHVDADLDAERAAEALTPAAALAVQLLLAPQATVRRVAEVLLFETLAAADSRRQGLVVIARASLHSTVMPKPCIRTTYNAWKVMTCSRSAVTSHERRQHALKHTQRSADALDLGGCSPESARLCA